MSEGGADRRRRGHPRSRALRVRHRDGDAEARLGRRIGRRRRQRLRRPGRLRRRQRRLLHGARPADGRRAGAERRRARPLPLRHRRRLATIYVTTVNRSDYADSFADRWWSFPHGEEIGLDPAANWETTADGRFLLFATTHNAGEYDGIDEVYRYDAAAAPGERLTCVSCPIPAGAASADALFARSAFVADDPGGTPPRAISADGSYVFFDTAQALRPDRHERTDRCLRVARRPIAAITPGRDPSDSFFLDSSADGKQRLLRHARSPGPGRHGRLG